MIKFLHLLSVIVFCTINRIECKNSIYDELRNYYDSKVQQQFKGEWKKYRLAFENEIASNLRENFGTRAMNIYEPGKHNAHLIARGFQLSDGVVMVYFDDMILRELPELQRPKLAMELPSNYVKFDSRLGRMFIDTTYYVARNSSSVVYAHPADQKYLSPFSLQQVDTIGKVVIVVEDCLMSGISIATLNGDSVTVGDNQIRLTDCQLMVEISTPDSGAPPVIAPYFPPGPRELLEMIIAKPIREELQTKLQGAMYSYINTSVLFGNQSVDFRTNQQKLFKSYADYMMDFVANLNGKTIKSNKAHVTLPDYQVTMDTETAQTRLQCHVALTDINLYGLDTAYVTRAGGPFNNGSFETAADTITFSSMQIRGKITHHDKNGSWTNDFSADLTDVTLIVVIVIKEKITNLQQIHFTGWRSLEFSIIPRETTQKVRHEHQSLVYGYILNELPVKVLNHVSSILGHGPIDENDNGGGGGGGNGGGSNNSDDDHNKNAEDISTGGSGEGGGGVNDNNDKKSTKKNKEFFSDDVLDDKFFSDDNFFSGEPLDKNFLNDSTEFLDKNFLNDSTEFLDKNIFNDSKENNANKEIKNIEGKKITTDTIDDVGTTTIGSDIGSDNNMNQEDEEGTKDLTDKKGVDVDKSNTASDDAVDNVTERNVLDEEGDQTEKNDKEPKNEDTPASGSSEEKENETMEKDFMQKDFFSDDFMQKDFFSDDEIKTQTESASNDKVENNNENNEDESYNEDNGKQVAEDERNSDVAVTEVNEYDKKPKNDDANSYSLDDTKAIFSDDTKPFFSDDTKPFFSDDKPLSDHFLDKDFFSNDDFEKSGDEKQDNTPENVEQNSTENGVQGDENRSNVDRTKEEDVESNNGKNSPIDSAENGNKEPHVDADGGEHENYKVRNTASAVKGYFSDDNKPFLSDDVLDKDFISDDSNEEKRARQKPKSGGTKLNKGNNREKADADGVNNKDNKGTLNKKLMVFVSREEGDKEFLDKNMFSDMEIERRHGSRRHVSQDKDPKHRDGDHIDLVDKRERESMEKNDTIKFESKENMTENAEESREGKKVDLESNVHNTRRHQNLHTSDNEIR